MLKLEGKESTEEFLCNPSTQPVPAGKWGKSSSLPIKVQPVPGLHEISALPGGHEVGLQMQRWQSCRGTPSPSSTPNLGRLNRALPEQHRSELTLNFHVLSHPPEL